MREKSDRPALRWPCSANRNRKNEVIPNVNAVITHVGAASDGEEYRGSDDGDRMRKHAIAPLHHHVLGVTLCAVTLS